MIDSQLRKLRRRIEEFLRHTTPEMLIKVAETCNIKVQKNLKNNFISKGDDE